MSALKLGDLTLDPRGFLFLPSIRVLACSGIRSALFCKTKHGREVAEKLNTAIERYQPEALLLMDPLKDSKGLQTLAKKWGTKVRIVFVSSKPDLASRALAESLKMEVHQELAWDKYRFVEFFETPPFLDPNEMQALDFQSLTIAGGKNYFVKIGHAPFDPLGIFSGERLSVFLKGIGRFKLPSFDPQGERTSIFMDTDNPFFSRYDVFAMGHSRILPLGKVTSLKKFASHNHLPVTKRALNHVDARSKLN